MKTKLCVRCGSEFKKNPRISIDRWENKIKYCSKLCANRQNTEDGKTGFFKGHKGYVKDYSFNKPFSEARKKKHSEAMKKSAKVAEHLEKLGKSKRGKNHWNWKGGVTKFNRSERATKEYEIWRKTVYARDHYNCKKCGVKCKSETIVAHHIKSWNEFIDLRYEISNGITVCRKCHKIIHKEIGLKTRFK